MDHEPNPEEVLDISGPEGETLFWHTLQHVVTKPSFRLQVDLDSLWLHYKDISDERLLAIVAALCVESAVQELLEAIGPGFGKLRDETDLTFSLKIKVVRGLRLIPSRILSACDLIRQIRNEFAHHLDRKALAQLDNEKYLRKIKTQLSGFSIRKRENSGYDFMFKELVSLTLMALLTYIRHVEQLREYIETDAFRQSFRRWNEMR